MILVPLERFELPTNGFEDHSSSAELQRRFGTPGRNQTALHELRRLSPVSAAGVYGVPGEFRNLDPRFKRPLLFL